MGQVIELLQTTTAARHNTLILIEQELRRRFRTEGLPDDDFIKLERAIKLRSSRLVDEITDFVDNAASIAPAFIPRFIERIDDDISFFVTLSIHGAPFFLENNVEKLVDYGNLLKQFANQLKGRLRGKGWSKAQSAEASHSFMSSFPESISSVFNLRDPAQLSAAVDIAVAGILAARPSASFERAVKLKLPPRAPEIWAKRHKSKGEDPITFLDRVWGDYIKAGVLYQDDIKRLGDDKLVQAVRSYCQKHPEHKASDVLPPPRRARLDQALAEVPPDSTAARLIKRKMRDREAMARKRAGLRPS